MMDSDGDIALESSDAQELIAYDDDSIVEPYEGMEFESEDAAKIFYDEYARHVGFVMRVMSCRRSERDGRILARRLGCNKEGHCVSIRGKFGPVRKPRASTREGCKAMIHVKYDKSSKWVITKFIKDHNHPLVVSPREARQTLDEKDKKIQELTAELRNKKRLCTTYQEQLTAFTEIVEEYNEQLSKKVQNVARIVGHHFCSEIKFPNFFNEDNQWPAREASLVVPYVAWCRLQPCEQIQFVRDCADVQALMELLNTLAVSSLRPPPPPDSKSKSKSCWGSMEVQMDDLNGTVETSAGGESNNIEVGPCQEPYEGMLFESEEAAKVFYDDYARRVGFVTRVLSSRKSERDGSIISRGLGCRGVSENRRKVMQKECGEGEVCPAMVMLKQEMPGRWVIKKFLGDHNHLLVIQSPKIRRTLDEKDKKIQELSAELRVKKRLSAAYRDQLLAFIKDIEDHNAHLSTKVQSVSNKLKELEVKAGALTR
ncbi:unnamed protein product [Malus baccata var. baccata]